MSSRRDLERQVVLNGLPLEYTGRLYRGERGNLITDDANRELRNSINYYIANFIEGDPSLTNQQKRNRYKELHSQIKRTVRNAGEKFKSNTMNAEDLYNGLVDTVSPLVEQIATRKEELRPPPRAEPLIDAEVIGVESAPLGIVDRFRSMFGRPLEIQPPLIEAQVVNTIPTAQVQVMPEPPSTPAPSFRRPVGGGAAPEDIKFI